MCSLIPSESKDFAGTITDIVPFTPLCLHETPIGKAVLFLPLSFSTVTEDLPPGIVFLDEYAGGGVGTGCFSWLFEDSFRKSTFVRIDGLKVGYSFEEVDLGPDRDVTVVACLNIRC